MQSIASFVHRHGRAIGIVACWLCLLGTDPAFTQAFDTTEFDGLHNVNASKEEICGAYAMKMLVLAAINEKSKCTQTGGFWSDPLSSYQACLTSMTPLEAYEGPAEANAQIQTCLACRQAEQSLIDTLTKATADHCEDQLYSYPSPAPYGFLATDGGAEQFCINTLPGLRRDYFKTAEVNRDIHYPNCLADRKRMRLSSFSFRASYTPAISFSLTSTAPAGPSSGGGKLSDATTSWIDVVSGNVSSNSAGPSSVYKCNERLGPCHVGTSSEAVAVGTSSDSIKKSLLWRFRWEPYRNPVVSNSTSTTLAALANSGMLEGGAGSSASKLNVIPPAPAKLKEIKPVEKEKPAPKISSKPPEGKTTVKPKEIAKPKDVAKSSSSSTAATKAARPPSGGLLDDDGPSGGGSGVSARGGGGGGGSGGSQAGGHRWRP